MSDWAETLRGLQRGDLEAFDQVTRLVTGYLGRIGAYRVRDSWDDLVQEILMALLRSPPRSEAPGAIVRHVQTTTQRKYLDELRRERGRRRRDPARPSATRGWRVNVALEQAGELPEPEGPSQEAGDVAVRKALEKLEPREREAVESRYVLGCSNEEGAARLSVSLATYKRLLSRGLSHLREQLVPEDPAA